MSSTFDKLININANQMQNIKEILSGINIPFPAQKVYITLLKEGKATARTLSHRTGITRTSIYDQLKALLRKGLIVERNIEGAAIFEVGDVRQLSILLDDRIEKLSDQQEYLKKNIAAMIEKSQSVQPKIRFFEGQDGAKHLLKDILWHDHITLHIYWPYEQMLLFLGSDFLLWFNERRKVRGIPLRTIWGNRKGKIKGHIFSDDGKDVERRYLTQKNIPSMGYIIYDKKVAFISSRKESFGFVVESVEFAKLQKMQFDVLWNWAKGKRK